ncbi:hypothetical protein SC499_24985 [Peribacillus simplex]|uniref:hypothetical protein n=1 Tax=Peribacillus simplex TaxID=1478 RepID=UPI00298E6966|nr:hypothetical protein [Peribacillus simplex]MDW7617833.1 hypothetical protein [Peribacillus simplex]
MTKNTYVFKVFLVLVFPVITFIYLFIYLCGSFGMIPAALGGLILLIALHSFIFTKIKQR